MRVREELRHNTALWVLPWLPFILVILLYSSGSEIRHRENPKDKMMPGASQLVDGADFVVRIRTPDGYEWPGWKQFRFLDTSTWKDIPKGFRILLLEDMQASLGRLARGLGLSSIVAIAAGLSMGAFPVVETLLLRFVSFFSFLPPLALLPLVFIYLGTGELAKVAIVFLGTVFDLTQNVYMRIKEVPSRYILRSYAQGASTPEVLFKIALRYKLPSILDSIRLAMRPAWVYLIAAELIAAEAGLGYRIALVQRTLQVNVILLYILTIAVMGFAFDMLVRWVVHRLFPWSERA